jgi:serine beta-lactamase-like protein LACTB, mitochondrial
MMSKHRIPILLTLIVGLAGLVLTVILGMWAHASATAPTLHPDPAKLPSVTRSDPPSKWRDAAARGRQTVRTDLAGQNLPGLSVAVGVDGAIVWAEGFGWADVDNGVAVAPETRFRVADASPPLTSAAVGLLLEQTKLNLDDEIQLHVPEFPRKQWPVTLRQLMAQVAGVATDRGGEAELCSTFVDDEWRLVARCNRTADGLKLDNFGERKLLFEPGTKYSPSTYGWILVSAAIEAAANEPFYTFMRTRVFEPLDMRDTTVDISIEAIPDRASFYYPRFAANTRYGPKPARVGDYSCYAGAAAFLSTPSDLVRFAMGVNGGRQGSGAQAGTLLKPETIRLFQTPQRVASGAETGYGLGWMLETVSLAGQPAPMAGHGSKPDFIGATTYLMTFPDRGLAVAVMANISHADTKSIALRIAQAFAEQKGK